MEGKEKHKIQEETDRERERERERVPNGAGEARVIQRHVIRLSRDFPNFLPFLGFPLLHSNSVICSILFRIPLSIIICFRLYNLSHMFA